MITGKKPAAPSNQGPTPGGRDVQPGVAKKAEAVDSMTYHDGGSKAQPAPPRIPVRRFVRTPETERERLRPVPPRLPVQEGPAVDDGAVMQLSQDDGGSDKKHLLAANKGLTLILRNPISQPAYWTFEGMNVDPHVHEVQRDVVPPGVGGGGQQTMHYTWDPTQVNGMGKSFTVTARFILPGSGPLKTLQFCIDRE